MKGKSEFSRLQLQLSLEELQSRLLEMEQDLGSLQRERDEAQRDALRLQDIAQVRTPL